MTRGKCWYMRHARHEQIVVTKTADIENKSNAGIKLIYFSHALIGLLPSRDDIDFIFQNRANRSLVQ